VYTAPAMSPVITYVVQTLLGLVVIGGIGAGIVFLARRAGVGPRGGPLTLVGRLPLDARRAIYLVRVGNVVYVVGASEAGLSKLGELDGASVPEGVAESGSGVLPVLGRFLSKEGAASARGRS
jgi:flagellar biogenesis protein FliO